MYKIIGYNGPRTKNQNTIYDVHENIYVSEAKLTLKDSTQIDDLTITVNKKNWLFTHSHPFKTHVEVYDDNKCIFRGRMLKPTKEMKDSGAFTHTYSFESIEAYLLDSAQRFYKNANATATDLLKHILKWHNKDVSVSHQVFLRHNDFEKSKTTHYVKIDYTSTWNALNTVLIKKFGGQLNFVHENNKNYLDYIDTNKKGYKESISHTSPILEIGSNLKSISFEQDPSNVVTRIVPLGAEIKPKKIRLGGDTTEDEDGSITGATHKVKGSWASAVKHAARLLGITLTSTEMKQMLHLIAGESSGRENCINTWDSNAKAGNPSIGLTQYTVSNFKKTALKGFTNQRKGFDCLLAFFNTSGWRQMLAYRWTHPNYAVIGSRVYPSIPKKYATKAHMKTLNKWGWPFPSVGEGHFSSGQLFGYHAGNGRRNNFHDGLDFGSVDHPGSAIHAIHGGTVVKIGYDSYIGWYVLTRSTDGYEIIYQEAFSSKSKIKLKTGDHFKTGAVIGYRDTSHVHIGICKKPYKWIDGYKHSFERWRWLDPQKLIKHGGEKGDKASTAKYYTPKKTGKRITIKKVNHGKDYLLADKTMIDQFGYIAKPVIFDSAKSAKDLLKKAKAYLKKQKQDFNKESYKISALELPQFSKFQVGHYYPTQTFGLVLEQNKLLKIAQKEIDIPNSPYNSSLEIGDRVSGITDYQIETNNTFRKKLESLESSMLGVNETISSVQNDADSLEDTVGVNADKAKANDDQSRFSAKMIRRDFNKYKKKTDKHLKKIDKKQKNHEDRITKLEQEFSALSSAVAGLSKGSGKK
ncbi:MAG: peptidoglycan DD-metalloendopeptidase family protein [Lactobacillus sp.]|nr:peptidoglycan DD-metalloendopeptidase family protein [Lactobacillus sp.]